jgi:lysine-specific histone demethylase 1B
MQRIADERGGQSSKGGDIFRINAILQTSPYGIMSPASKPIDTLVVGAGWAGLMSALNLTQAGKSVLVLEARPRIGGRAFTHTWRENTLQDTQRTLKAGEKGFATDFGCSYIHGYNEGNPAREIAKRFGVPTFVPKPTQTRIVGPNGILPSSLSQRLQANLQAAQDFAKSKARSLRSNESTSSTPEVTLSSVLIDDEKSPLYADLNTAEDRTLAASYARSMHIPLGTEMEHVSLQHFGSENNYGGTDAVPQGGFTVLIDKIADQIGRGNIKLGAEASKIKYDRGTSSVHVTTRSQDSGEEQTHVARNAIVTVPLAVLRKMQGSFDPPLDGRRVDAMERVTVGNLNKVR